MFAIFIDYQWKQYTMHIVDNERGTTIIISRITYYQLKEKHETKFLGGNYYELIGVKQPDNII